ncbi:MAG: hypothetical protein HZA19_02975 [Nitrospirae bacterium]|nr:hypothetical protein [Nitrospirota bacterium]
MENTLMNFGISSTSPYGGWIQVSDASDLAVNYPLRLNPNGGNVGIGTASPNKILELNSTDPSIRFQYTGNAGWAQVSSDGANQLMFYAESLERVRIDTSGNVGIGTTNPGIYKLYVNGDAFVQGNIAAKYQDIAEWVPASESIPAGTVLILDSDHFNQVEASSQAYDTRVAGVITDTPGILLGEGGEGKVKVATTGRVKVKVDATRAPVQVGDLLVTSDREGYAMKSQPIDVGGIPIHRPGTLIGKALEPLKGGQGEILVLLSLQ